MNGVLLLNADFTPLRIVHPDRAVELIWEQKAELIEDSGRAYHSAYLIIPVPSVARMLYWVKTPFRKRLPVTRRNVLARDDGRCGYCLGPASTVDHIRPRSKGGKHRWENVVAACAPCNGRKDNRQLSELGWTLHVKPRVPEGQVWTAVTTRGDPLWERYLPTLA